MNKKYDNLNMQGENLKRVINFDNPMWTPVVYNILPCAWIKHGEALSDLMVAHPRLFPDYKKPDKYTPPILEGLFAPGQLTDCWGCVWENLHPGIIGQVVKHPLADWDNFALWERPDPMKDALLGPRNWDALKADIEKKKKNGSFAPDSVLPHGFHYLLLADLCGFEKNMIDMAMEEPMLDKLIDVIIDYNSKVVNKLFELGCEFLALAEDLGTQKSLPISVEMWRKYVKPGYEATAGQARDRGIPVFLHSDGHILPIIDDLIETGVTIINPQVRPNTLEGLLEHVKGKMTICLDLDRQLFPFASPQQLKEHVYEAHEILSSPEGGLMFNIEICDNIPLNNIEALFSALEDTCNLPFPEDTGGVSIGF